MGLVANRSSYWRHHVLHRSQYQRGSGLPKRVLYQMCQMYVPNSSCAGGMGFFLVLVEEADATNLLYLFSMKVRESVIFIHVDSNGCRRNNSCLKCFQLIVGGPCSEIMLSFLVADQFWLQMSTNDWSLKARNKFHFTFIFSLRLRWALLRWQSSLRLYFSFDWSFSLYCCDVYDVPVFSAVVWFTCE